MSKKILITLGIAAAAIILGIGVYHSDASQNNEILSEAEVKSLISSQYTGDIEKMTLDEKSKQPVYRIVMSNDTAEYEINVDAHSGEIKHLKETRTLTVKETNDKAAKEDKTETKQKVAAKEETQEKQTNTEAKAKTTIEAKDSQKEQQQKKTPQKQSKKGNKKAVISKDKAIQIALQEFSGKVTDVDFEEDDGRLFYEIEIDRGELEAEMKIDAYTGDIIVIEIDD